MAAPLDFSDLTGKKKKPVAPQQTNSQGFYSPDKVPQKETQEAPKTMGYPVQKTQAGDPTIAEEPSLIAQNWEKMHEFIGWR